MNKVERVQFLNNLKADVQEYRKLYTVDDKSAEVFDAKKLREDWEDVGKDICSSIEKAKEQNEK